MSTESLKKSAKKLHRALQEGKALSLMQVQHLLAQSHGYSSWNEALVGEKPKGKYRGPWDVSQKLSWGDLEDLQERELKGIDLHTELPLSSLKLEPSQNSVTAPATPQVVVDEEGFVIYSYGLDTEALEVLKEQLECLLKDPDYIMIVSYNVRVEGTAEFKSRIFCYPGLSFEELGAKREALDAIMTENGKVRLVYGASKADSLLRVWHLVRPLIPTDTECEARIRFDSTDFLAMKFKYGDHQESRRWKLSSKYYDAEAELSGTFLEILDMSKKEAQHFEVVFFVSPLVNRRLDANSYLQRTIASILTPRRGVPKSLDPLGN